MKLHWWMPAAVLLLAPGCGDESTPAQTAASRPDATPNAPWFRDQSAQRGVTFTCDTYLHEAPWMPEICVGAAAAIDFNDDGWQDLYLLQASGEGGNRLLRNRGDGTFEDVTAESGAGDSGYGSGVAVGDVDGDGDQDIFVANLGDDVLLKNHGDGTFTDASASAGLSAPGWGTSSSFFDADGDGDLDLFVCRYIEWSPEGVLPCLGVNVGDMETRDYCKPSRYPQTPDVLYANDGTGRFTDVSEASGIASVTGYGLGIGTADFDDDGDVDMFVANDTIPDRLWKNDGQGNFQETGFAMACDRDNSGLAKAGMGVSVADLDRDGRPDLIVCNLRGESDSLYLNKGTHFQDVTTRAGLSKHSYHYTRFGLGLVDFDNDGVLDYFSANGAVLADPDSPLDDKYAHSNLLLRGSDTGLGFEAIPEMGGLDAMTPRTSRGAVFADFNNDGGMDILVMNRDAPARLLMNTVPDRGHWLLLDVRDPAGAPAIGARVEVQTPKGTITDTVRTDSSYIAARDHRVHVGLAAAEQADQIRVIWPDGTTTELGPTKADQVVRIPHPGGAAPGSR
ncbi:MAG: CRTAC1 family protein [Phycisphaerales bacterium]|nr:CRTAC1 family protein [Phycisphaerales bacterium]